MRIFRQGAGTNPDLNRLDTTLQSASRPARSPASSAASFPASWTGLAFSSDSRTPAPEPVLIRQVRSASPGMPPDGHHSLRRWLSEVRFLDAHGQEIQGHLLEMTASRQLPNQIAYLKQLPALHGVRDLGPAVIRHNREQVAQEGWLMHEARQLQAEWERRVGLLTPKVLLQQARTEWDELAHDARADDAERLNRGEDVVGCLVELVDALHHDQPVPDVCSWVVSRVHDLDQERRRLSFDDPPLSPRT